MRFQMGADNVCAYSPEEDAKRGDFWEEVGNIVKRVYLQWYIGDFRKC